jgi:hypothetical protein
MAGDPALSFRGCCFLHHSGQGFTMAICDTCGNDYDKTFIITRGDLSGTFDSVLSGPFMPWRRGVHTAVAGSSDTASRVRRECTAAPTAPATPVRQRQPAGHNTEDRRASFVPALSPGKRLGLQKSPGREVI